MLIRKELKKLCITLQLYGFYWRASSWTKTPSRGFMIVVRTMVGKGSTVLSQVLATNWRKTLAKAIFISSSANLPPMQLRGPVPKGKKVIGWRLAFSSGRCLRGSKTSGSGQYLGSRWIDQTGTSTTASTGIVTPLMVVVSLHSRETNLKVRGEIPVIFVNAIITIKWQRYSQGHRRINSKRFVNDQIHVVQQIYVFVCDFGIRSDFINDFVVHLLLDIGVET